jgi:Tfp pilus assembly protein PilO
VVLSKRERWIAAVTGAALSVLLLDHFVVEPLLERKNDLDAKISLAQLDAEKNRKLFATRSRLSKEWMQLVGRGLPPDETRVLQDLGRWAQDSGMNLPIVNPSRPEREKDFYRITIRLTGTGGMSQIGHFLYRIQTATVPIRITDLTMSSRKEGSDDLQVTMGVSTIYPIPDAERNQNASPSGAPAASASARPQFTENAW